MSNIAICHPCSDFPSAIRSVFLSGTQNLQHTQDRVFENKVFYIVSDIEKATSLHKENSESPYLIKAKGELLAYKDLGKDWDGYGGIAPSVELIETSILLLDRIFQETRSTPTPMLSNSGEIGFFWKTSAHSQVTYIELGINHDGLTYSYLIEKDGQFFGEEDISIKNGVPKELSSNILLISKNAASKKEAVNNKQTQAECPYWYLNDYISDRGGVKNWKNTQFIKIL